MKLLRSITEDEVISVFLKGEIKSKRFGKEIVAALKGRGREIITHPSLKSRKDNIFRRNLLAKVRGFGKNRDLFENFPADVKWFKAIIDAKELKKAMYINYSYWNELSNGTRLPLNSAKNIKENVKVFNVSNKLYWEILAAIKKGKKIEPMIFVAKNRKSRLGVLEGHARLTAYFLEPQMIPKKVEVILGYSDKMDLWDLY